MTTAIDLFEKLECRDHLAVSVSDLRRFFEKVEDKGDCWEWAVGLMGGGYGQFHFDGKPNYAHRWIYELVNGPVGSDLTLDHLCRNRKCVRPDHLEPVTRGENVLRGVGPSAIAAKATHCPQGHPYSGENLTVKKDGTRRCKTCHRERERTRRQRKSDQRAA